MVIKETIESAFFNEPRDIYIYLPPGYEENEDRHYPCLYMQDGQNLFSTQGDSPYGKWDVDITADNLIEEGKIDELIVVGVSNSQWRDDEYTPTFDRSEKSGGMADVYLQFLTQEVIPFINENYRVIADRDATAICGSSLGGLLSLYAIMASPDVFASAAVMSPSIWWDNKVILDMVNSNEYDTDSLKIWLDMGYYEQGDEDEDEGEEEAEDNGGGSGDSDEDGEEAEEGSDETEEDSGEENEEDDPLENARVLCDLLREKGFKDGENFVYYEDPWGLHNEDSWAGRMEMILQFLFPGEEQEEDEE